MQTPSPKILVVEDSPFVRTIMGVILRDYVILFASGEAEARQLFRQNQDIALAISDCQLEDGDGVTFLTSVLQERRVPVLLISGSCVPEVTSSIPFLAKPFYPQQLRDTVREMLARSSAAA